MEKRKAIEATDGEAAANPDKASEQPQPKIDLPYVESPSISPAEMVGSTESIVAITSAATVAPQRIAGREHVQESSSLLLAPAASTSRATRRLGGDCRRIRCGCWRGIHRRLR